MLRRLRRRVLRLRGASAARDKDFVDGRQLVEATPAPSGVRLAEEEPCGAPPLRGELRGVVGRACEAAKGKARALAARFRGPRSATPPSRPRSGRPSLCSPEDINNSMSSEQLTDSALGTQKGLSAVDAGTDSCGSVCSLIPKVPIVLCPQESATALAEKPRCDLAQLEAAQDALRREQAARHADAVAAAALQSEADELRRRAACSAAQAQAAEERLAAQSSVVAALEAKIEDLEQQLHKARETQPAGTAGEVHVGRFAYRPDKILGTGGFGTVYGGALPVAVKKITAAPLDAECMHKLSSNGHPNIIALYSVVSTAAGSFIAMEHAGEDLHSVVERKDNDMAKCIMWAPEAVQAVRHLATMGIVHGDVKTCNYLLVNGHAKLADLDSAREVGAKVGAGVSVHFAPPEAYKRGTVLSTHWDVWSVAVVVHHVLTTELPVGVTGDFGELPAEAVARARQVLTKDGDQEPRNSAVWEAGLVCSWRMLHCGLLPPGTELGPRPRNSAVAWLARSWALYPSERGTAADIAAHLRDLAAVFAR